MIAAVQNVVRLESVFGRLHPHVVFNTAAHMPVPLLKQDPEEAVINNGIGSRNPIDLPLRHGLTHFVIVFTDKAVNATSVFGGVEARRDACLGGVAERGSRPDLVPVRIGSVLGSRGVAVPIFMNQIAQGGPVTVTHPDTIRYFMTIQAASRLVLHASAQGRNREVCILDMGDRVRVVDSVRNLIRLSELGPEVDAPIVLTGERPGERLVEELMTEEECGDWTRHEEIFVARGEPVGKEVLPLVIDRLAQVPRDHDGVQNGQFLFEFVGASANGVAADTRVGVGESCRESLAVVPRCGSWRSMASGRAIA